MPSREPRRRDVGASVRQRLLNRAHARGEEFNYTLSQYAIERFLYRLAQSRQRDRFVLKGATLFAVWRGEPHRATWDLDLLGRGASTVAAVEGAVREVCRTVVEDDGVTFDANSVRGERIREGAHYQGVRARLRASLGQARIPLQVDVAFGDAVTPAPRREPYPTALDQPPPEVLAYPRETVIAEKLEAIVSLGAPNSRMKDFYDLYYLAGRFTYGGRVLAEAIHRTFERRATPIPEGLPFGFSDAFANDPKRAVHWRAFTRRARLPAQDVRLPEVIDALRAFVIPPMAAAHRATSFDRTWKPGGPWV